LDVVVEGDGEGDVEVGVGLGDGRGQDGEAGTVVVRDGSGGGVGAGDGGDLGGGGSGDGAQVDGELLVGLDDRVPLDGHGDVVRFAGRSGEVEGGRVEGVVAAAGGSVGAADGHVKPAL